jgi:alpha-1,2-mannosyltransferase
LWTGSLVAVCNLLVVLGLWLAGDTLGGSARAAPAKLAIRLFGKVGVDSWFAMAYTLEGHERNPAGDLYFALFEDGYKFQYPPSALLFLELVPDRVLALASDLSRAHDEATWRLFSTGGSIAALATIVVSLACYLRLARLGRPLRLDADVLLSGASAVFLGLTFYPLMKGHVLGQIQIYIDLLVALAFYLYLRGYKAAAGVCLGLCCLVKPQYAVMLVWGGLRREGTFSLAMAAVGTTGLALSLARFGLSDHLRYLEVLKMISSTGEVYWPNESVNGMAHRWFGTASPLLFTRDFAPRHAVVQILTTTSGVLLLGSALWPLPGSKWRGSTLDLALCVVAATMASPIVWEHHYGTFFSVFAVTAPVVLAQPQTTRARWALLAAYLLMANLIERPELLYAHRLVGILATNVFWGGLLLWGLLQSMLRRAPDGHAERGEREVMRPA